jgi:hypothetical protein
MLPTQQPYLSMHASGFIVALLVRPCFALNKVTVVWRVRMAQLVVLLACKETAKR